MRIEQDILPLLDDIILEQGLGSIQDIPCIIYVEGTIYYNAYLIDETKDYLSIVCVNEKGQEYGKILNKNYISSIEIMYADMIPEKNNEKKEDGLYG